MIKLNYKTTKVVVTKDNIDDLFVVTKNRRQIRKTGVGNLKTQLNQGKHFETPLVANKIDDKYRLLDGNHRYEAMKDYFDKHEDEKIEININYYEDLTKDAEKEVYTKWNLGTKQTRNDFLQQYFDNIQVVKLFENDFPCSVGVYPQKNEISFGRILDAYSIATSPSGGFGIIHSGKLMVDRAKRLTSTDYQYLFAYFSIHKASFGDIENNEYINACILPGLMKVWWDNKIRFKAKDFVKYFKQRLFNKTGLLIWAKQHGPGAKAQAYTNIKSMLNKGMKTHKFV